MGGDGIDGQRGFVLFGFQSSKTTVSDNVPLVFSCVCDLFECLSGDCGGNNDFTPLILLVKRQEKWHPQWRVSAVPPIVLPTGSVQDGGGHWFWCLIGLTGRGFVRCWIVMFHGGAQPVP